MDTIKNGSLKRLSKAITNTISYYDDNANEYYYSTVGVDMTNCYTTFIQYLPTSGRIIDIGSGSGRDLLFFKKRGYQVEGIDASDAMCKLAQDYAGASVDNVRIQDWNPQKKYDGIWACASLVHLEEKDILSFFLKAERVLNNKGVMFISVKEGITTGFDSSGRYFHNFDDVLINEILMNTKSLQIVEDWHSKDSLHRMSFTWRNIVFRKEE